MSKFVKVFDKEVHYSYVINLDHIALINLETGVITLDCNRNIYLEKAKLQELLDKIQYDD